jgi:3-mercaptopyruvate sulfurtransferase SseA
VVDLKAKGIENAAALLGGFMAWQNAGLPVESNQTSVQTRTPTQAELQAPTQAPQQIPKQAPKP